MANLCFRVHGSPSRPVTTNQNGVHDRLDEVVRRHLATAWRKPIQAHSRVAFERAVAVAADGRPLVLDSGCGNAESALKLAARHSECRVIAVDKSAHRLARSPALPDNVTVVRADLADFWRLAAAAGWRLDYHYLLYPNPWPKTDQLMRRWYAHPVLSALLSLGGRLEVRSNWLLYLQEFARALALAGRDSTRIEPLAAASALTPFERKYARSGHELYQLVSNLEE